MSLQIPLIHIIQIFLSSPSDVTEACCLAEQVIQELPNHYVFRTKAKLALIA